MGVTQRTQLSSQEQKIGRSFKGPFIITRVHENGTALIRSKSAKHDNLVNTNLLVKYNRPGDEKEKAKEIAIENESSADEEEQNDQRETIETPKRKYNKRIVENRPDGGPNYKKQKSNHLKCE